MKASWKVLMLDQELLLFPILSLIATGLVTVTFFVPLAGSRFWPSPNVTPPATDAVYYVVLFLFYVCTYFVVIFFNASLIAAVHLRLTGGNPTLMDGISGAWTRRGELFTWALVAATVGLILQMMKDRSQWVLRAVIGVLGVAWNLVTYFVVPVLVIEGKGPIEAVHESAGILKRTWGEELVGGVSYGLVSWVLAIPAVLVALFGFVMAATGQLTQGLLLVGLAIFYAFLLSLTMATLSSIFNVAVYHYARTGTVPEGFDPALLQSAFVKK